VPLLLGVTGSIAAGKSLLCTHLAKNFEAVHVDADREVHRLYEPDTEGFERVVAEFGESIVGTDGVIDRRVLGAMVFGKPERMEALRTAIGDIPAHFMTLLSRWREELPENRLAVLEAVNLLENNYMTRADAAWLVVTEDETAITRLMETRSLSREEANQRLASAKDWRQRAPAADRLFYNDGTKAAFLSEINEAISDTITAYNEGRLPRPRWYEAQE
tara:strand:+ start:985 stop:1638 length:654 start_codon:yes stop_codon:yes gene_type:complete